MPEQKVVDKISEKITLPIQVQTTRGGIPAGLRKMHKSQLKHILSKFIEL